jgi:hypothetical protein
MFIIGPALSSTVGLSSGPWPSLVMFVVVFNLDIFLCTMFQLQVRENKNGFPTGCFLLFERNFQPNWLAGIAIL